MEQHTHNLNWHAGWAQDRPSVGYRLARRFVKFLSWAVSPVRVEGLDYLPARDDISLESSLFKMVAARTALDASTNAIQLCGSYGLQDEAHLYPILLDALAVTIGGGTEEAHRSIMVAEMVRRHCASRCRGQL